MYGILISAFFSLMGWLLRAVAVKAIFFTLFFYITTEAVQALISKLAGTGNVNGVATALAGLPSGALWLMAMFKLDTGIPLLFAAYATAFAIRRIPVIG